MEGLFHHPVKIRAATSKDAAPISALIRDLSARYIAQEFSTEAASALLASMEKAAIQAYMAAGYRYHLAECDGRLAGVVAMAEHRHLYHLFVAEPFQGRGLARRLWELARATALEAGNPGIFTVNASRYAVGMYEKFGFVRQSEATDCAGIISIPMKLEWT